MEETEQTLANVIATYATAPGTSQLFKTKPINSFRYHIIFFRLGHYKLLTPFERDACEYDISSAFVLDKRMDGTVTPKVDWEHDHHVRYRSVLCWGWGAQQRTEIWLGREDKRNHWGQQVVHGETSSFENQHHDPPQLLTCCLWS